MEMTRNSFNKKVDAEDGGIKIVFEQHAWTKIMGWCRAAKSEVSGVGMVENRIVDGKGVLFVYDTFLPKQSCNSSYTELDDDAVAKLNYKQYKKGRDTSHMRLWWHTHYNFNVFWSGTDVDTAMEMVNGNGDWLLSVVINQKGEYRARYDQVKPVPVYLDNLDLSIARNEHRFKRKRNFKTDIKKWVRPFVPEIPKYVHSAVKKYDYGNHSQRSMDQWLKEFEAEPGIGIVECKEREWNSDWNPGLPFSGNQDLMADSREMSWQEQLEADRAEAARIAAIRAKYVKPAESLVPAFSRNEHVKSSYVMHGGILWSREEFEEAKREGLI